MDTTSCKAGGDGFSRSRVVRRSVSVSEIADPFPHGIEVLLLPVTVILMYGALYAAAPFLGFAGGLTEFDGFGTIK
jgi:hypothetical protein